MDALFPYLMIAAIVEAAWESIKMIRKSEFLWDHIIVFAMGLLLYVITKTNLFRLVGLPGDGLLYWYASYFFAALITMRGAGVLHDLYKSSKLLKESFPNE